MFNHLLAGVDIIQHATLLLAGNMLESMLTKPSPESIDQITVLRSVTCKP